MKEIYNRLLKKTPPFWRKMRSICIAIGACGLLIISNPENYLDIVQNMGDVFCTIGLFGTFLSQLTVEDKSEHQDPSKLL